MKQHSALWPAIAMVLNAFFWGLSWWPMHVLRDQGVHALWVTFLSYVVAVVLVVLWQPHALSKVMRDRRLWLLMLTSGMTNACFNWAVSVGDVVRVVLLMYLLPLWTVLISWIVLRQKPTAFTLFRVAMSLSGIVLVLQPAHYHWSQFSFPLPSSLIDWLALLSGFALASTSIALSRMEQIATAPKILSMFLGCLFLSGLLAFGMRTLGAAGVSALPALQWSWFQIILLVVLQIAFCNLFLQYGAMRLSTNTVALLLTFEVLFAALSSAWLGASELTARVLIGGFLIVAAAALAAFDKRHEAPKRSRIHAA